MENVYSIHILISSNTSKVKFKGKSSDKIVACTANRSPGVTVKWPDWNSAKHTCRRVSQRDATIYRRNISFRWDYSQCKQQESIDWSVFRNLQWFSYIVCCCYGKKTHIWSNFLSWVQSLSLEWLFRVWNFSSGLCLKSEIRTDSCWGQNFSTIYFEIYLEFLFLWKYIT